MDSLTKLARLQRLVAEADGKVDGRKKLHKLVYLCQRAGTDLDQSFVFYMYGVYSPSLAMDLKTAIQWGPLKEQQDGDAYDILLGDACIDAKEMDDQDRRPDFTVARVLGGETASMLEALSTIVYLYDNGYLDLDLQDKLTSLKPHLRHLFPKAFELAEEHFDVRVERSDRRGVTLAGRR